ncbi:MAG: hypothetical protein ACREOZ_00205 [Gloeomargaritales cyanobacterium]
MAIGTDEIFDTESLCLIGLFFVTMAIMMDESFRENRMEVPSKEGQKERVIEAVIRELEASQRQSVLRRRYNHNNDNGGDRELPNRKKRYICYDRDRAMESVESDYLGPRPTFDDKQFQRTFRISKTKCEMILASLAVNDPFFRETNDCTGRKSIAPQVKLLSALRYLAYGTSHNSFVDYFQMGESTACLCAKKVARGIVNHIDLEAKYNRAMTKEDARRLSHLHHDVHGVAGMIGSLDCMHVSWKNCPVAYHGQYQGKERVPTIVLEAMADHNLWIWHAAFGFPGSLNDINIWDQSPLHRALVDGTWGNDFEFRVGNETFDKLWILGELSIK